MWSACNFHSSTVPRCPFVSCSQGSGSRRSRYIPVSFCRMCVSSVIFEWLKLAFFLPQESFVILPIRLEIGKNKKESKYFRIISPIHCVNQSSLLWSFQWQQAKEALKKELAQRLSKGMQATKRGILMKRCNAVVFAGLPSQRKTAVQWDTAMTDVQGGHLVGDVVWCEGQVPFARSELTLMVRNTHLPGPLWDLCCVPQAFKRVEALETTEAEMGTLDSFFLHL